VKAISRSGALAALVIPLALATLSLSGCGLFVPKLQAPTLTVVGVDLLKSDLWEQHLRVRMHVQNPNDRTLPIKGISYTMDVSGQEFASGESGASFVVPARGAATIAAVRSTTASAVRCPCPKDCCVRSRSSSGAPSR
jgi:LEA14-like dessication related protein